MIVHSFWAMPPKPTTKEAIDRAALELFVVQGIAETSIREIAQAARVSQGAMYNHYRSKEELAWRLWFDVFTDIARRLRQNMQENKGIDAQIRAMVRTVFVWFDTDWVAVTFGFRTRHQFLPQVSPKAGSPYLVFRTAIARAIRRGELPPQEIELATSMVTGAIMQVIDVKILGRIPGKLADMSDQVAASCLGVLRP